MTMQRRILLALGAFVLVYALGFMMGAVLYTTGAIGTGPLHTECEGYADQIAEEQGIPEEDVAQEDIKELAIACHEAEKAEITEKEAFVSTYLYWSLWPAAIVAATIIFWPWWAAILHRQELADPHVEGGLH